MKGVSHGRALRRTPGAVPGLFLAPALLILAGVTLYPLVEIVRLSLRRRILTFGIDEYVGAANWLHLLEDARFWNAFGNTALFTGVSVGLELLLGIAIGILLNRRFRGRGAMRAVVLVPWVIPTVVSAKIWAWLYHPRLGLLNHLLGTRVDWLGDPVRAMGAAILMDAWKTTPFVALLVIAGLQGIPEEVYRAARVDGASPWTTFRRITLPMLRPVILVVLVFRTLDAFRVFDAVYVLTGGGPANATETLSIYAWKLLFQTLQFGYGSTVALVVFLSVGLMTVFYARLLRRTW
jgi:multiple sugar transport system permease protein